MDRLEQHAFILQCFETYYRALERRAETLVRMPAPPEDMCASPLDAEGWAKWKLIPSPVTAGELDGLEREWGVPFPPLLRALLSTCCHYFRDGVCCQPSTAPLRQFQTVWNPVLVRSGYLPFAWDSEGCFLRCIDVIPMPDEARCPILQIDHEKLFDFDEDTSVRADIAPEMQFVADNLQVFLAQTFLTP